MSNFSYQNLDKCFEALKLDLNAVQFSKLAQELSLDVHEISVVEHVLDYLYQKKQRTTIETMLKMSRLPTKNQKTFGNFDFSVLKGKEVEKVMALPSLSAIYAHRNIAFIGRPAQRKRTWHRLSAMSAASTDSKHTSSRCPSCVISSQRPEGPARNPPSSTDWYATPA